MKSEYLIFNIAIVTGPVLFSFDRHVRFVRQWLRVLLCTFIVSIPFLFWDILANGRHWSFNSRFIMPLRILGLPLEEGLFFLTVPFACLFIWEIILVKVKPSQKIRSRFLPFLHLPFMISGALFLYIGKEYTGLALCMLGIAIFSDLQFKTGLIQYPMFYGYLLIVTGLILVFNGYLTARPIVLYGIQYQLDIHIWTIPVEDFIYGLSLILMNTVLYQKLRKRP